MASYLNRRTVMNTGLAASALALSGPSVAATEPLKVGFVYPSPIADNGWSYRHEIGRQDVVAEFGDQVETTFVESVPEGADAKRVITQLAISGHKLIFTCSFGYMDPTLEVASKFPNVFFEHNTGFKTAENVSVYNARFHEGRSVFGNIAAQMTKTGVVGYIASFPIPEVIMGINAFTLAAQKLRPDIQVKVVWVYTWFDPAKEADAARALLEQGADFITQHTNSPAPCKSAEAAGASCFGQDADMTIFAPKAHLTGIVNNWSPYYIRRVRDVMNGTWTTQHSWDGIAEGVVQMAPYNKGSLPADVLASAIATEEAIRNGSLHPFEGPITKADGTEVIGDGAKLSNDQVHSMNYFVKGVQGQIPS